MAFEEQYSEWIARHLASRQGERARRLEEGHGHAESLFVEKVWWPSFWSLDHLHPEYEVNDFKDGYRYLDFAYIRSGLLLAVEIDGYGPHLRNISRLQFSDHCRRQNDLILDGWMVLRFTYDDVKESPRYCQQTLQQFMGRWLGEGKLVQVIDYVEKEIIRLFLRTGRPLTPGDICRHMRVENKTARKWLRQMADKNWLEPARGSERIRSYQLSMEGKRFVI